MRGDQCLAEGRSAVTSRNFAVGQDLEAVFDEPRRVQYDFSFSLAVTTGSDIPVSACSGKPALCRD